jgi:ribose transport system permease protein
MKKEFGLFMLLVVLCLIVCGVEIGTQLHDISVFHREHPNESAPSLQLPRFLSQANLTSTGNLIGLYGVFSLGLGLVIITGGIDLSVGSMLALVGVLLAMSLAEWHWPWPLAVVFVLSVAMALGWFHGMLVMRAKLQPFIVTLCGLLLYRGMARYIAHDNTKGFSEATGIEALRSLASGKVFGVPTPVVILAVVSIVMWFVLHRSIYGRYLLAVGRNEQAARFSGINTRLVATSAYVIAALLTGVAGILIAFYTRSISPSNYASSYELYGIAAAVLGGCSLRGGEGSVIGIVIGTALLLVLQNLVNLLGIDSSLNFAVMGGVVLLGVLVDQYFKTRAEKKTVRAAK